MSAVRSLRIAKTESPQPAQRGGAVILFSLALAGGLLWPAVDDGHADSPGAPRGGSDVVVVSLAHLDLPATHANEDGGAAPAKRATAGEITIGALPHRAQPTLLPVWAPVPLALRAQAEEAERRQVAVSAVAAVPRETTYPPIGEKTSLNFAAYRALQRFAAVQAIYRTQQDAELTRTIVGIASTYNPFGPGKEEGGLQTASGELYDPAAWTAAIQIHLRWQFGGVRYGRNYRPAYALVDSGDKKLIVKINDVGPLRPGRVIDLNERAMRYFDPTMRRGILHDVKLTLLPGEDWTPGPIWGADLISLASAE